MLIDSLTVLLFGLCAKLLLGGLFVVFWIRDRAAHWFAWWGATFLLACVTSLVFMSRVTDGQDSIVAIALGNAALIMSFACCWQGARTFDHREPLWWPVFCAPALWLLACLVPFFLESLTLRILLSSLLSAPLLAMCSFEFWRGREERLLSRWPVIIIFASFATLLGARVPFVGLLPFPFGALPAESTWIGIFNLLMFGHTILLAMLLVSMSKERLELHERIRAQTDPLTGALNRRAFMARGEIMLRRHRYEDRPLCVLFLDIDRFKQLNDRFGHSGGDDVLVGFVALVSACIRPTDFLFRIGGEEFCCLLPNTTADQAHLVGERVRHCFEALTLDVAGVPVKATVSLGIASTESFGYDIETLMRRADMAVYAAKRQGRNRVVIASPDDGDLAGGGRAAAV